MGIFHRMQGAVPPQQLSVKRTSWRRTAKTQLGSIVVPSVTSAHSCCTASTPSAAQTGTTAPRSSGATAPRRKHFRDRSLNAPKHSGRPHIHQIGRDMFHNVSRTLLIGVPSLVLSHYGVQVPRWPDAKLSLCHNASTQLCRHKPQAVANIHT